MLKSCRDWDSLDHHPQAGKEEEEDCSRQSPARSPRAGEDAKGGAMLKGSGPGVSLARC